MSLESLMFFGSYNEEMETLHNNREKQVWPIQDLYRSLEKTISEKLKPFIQHMEISEDQEKHQTVIKIVLNERKYLMEKMIDPLFNPEESLYQIITFNFAALYPRIEITVE